MTNFKDLVADYLNKPAERKLLLQFGDCIIQHNTANKTLHEELCHYFAPFVIDGQSKADIAITSIESGEVNLDVTYEIKQPDPGKKKIKEEFFNTDDGMRIVRKRLTGMHFIFGKGQNLAIGPCLENSNQVINFINNRHIEHNLNKGAVLLHAAGVVLGGKGAAIAGFSGMGKSTLALHLLSEGLDFVSNDRLTSYRNNEQPVMNGVAKLPRINPGTALNNKDLSEVIPKDRMDALSQMPTEELWDLEEKYDVFIDRCFKNSKFLLSAPMNTLFILNWSLGGGALKVKEVNTSEDISLFPAFMKSTGLFYLPADETKQLNSTEQQYKAALEGCKIYELSGGVDFESATKECIKILQQL